MRAKLICAKKKKKKDVCVRACVRACVRVCVCVCVCGALVCIFVLVGVHACVGSDS